MTSQSPKILKVGSGTTTGKFAGALAKHVREGIPLEIQIIGAAALNQAMKGVALARQFLQEDGLEIAVRPYLVDLPLEEVIRNTNGAFRRNDSTDTEMRTCFRLIIDVLKGAEDALPTARQEKDV